MESSKSLGRTKSSARKKVASNVPIPISLQRDVSPTHDQPQPSTKRISKPSSKRKAVVKEKEQPQRKKKKTQEKPQEGVSKWFSNKEQEELFHESFSSKKVVPLKFLNFDELSTTNLEVFDLLKFQGLERFLQISTGNIIPDLIKVFYCNLTFNNNVLRSKVKGISIKITKSLLFELFGIKEKGPNVDEGDQIPSDYNRYVFYKSMCRKTYVQKQRVREILNVGPLSPSDRLLHYIITYILVPRNTNHATLPDHDLYLMYLIKNKTKLRWYSLIANHIMKSRNTSALPYAFHIMHILNHFNVNFANESQVQLSKRLCCISISSLGKLDIVLDVTDNRYKFSHELGKEAKERTKKAKEKEPTQPLSSISQSTIEDYLKEILLRVKRIEDHLGLPPLQVEEPTIVVSDEDSEDDQDQEGQQQEKEAEVESSNEETEDTEEENVEGEDEEEIEPLATKMPKEFFPSTEVSTKKVIADVLTQLQQPSTSQVAESSSDTNST